LRLPPEPSNEAEEDEARALAGQAAMRAIEHKQIDLAEGRTDADLCAEAAARAMERYNRRILSMGGTKESKHHSREMAKLEQRLRLAGLRAERDTFYRLRRERKIEDRLLRRLVREVDLLETRYGS
jgi:CPA1 family monovalent cation:H+ antiporter